MTRTNAMLSAMLVLAAINKVYAQYTPPPWPVAYPGLINEALRSNTNYPVMKSFDVGGMERLRVEDHEGYNIPGVPGTPAKANNDFRANGADTENSYFLSRLRLHVGYADKWWGAYVEGQSSMVAGDQRWAYFASPTPAGEVNRKANGPESDVINLHQAFVTVGSSKFPLSLKVGRQVLSYGEERLIGAYDWNNISRVFDAAKLHWQSGWASADAFTSRVVIPQDEYFATDNDHEQFSGVYATTAKIPANILDACFLARNASPKALTDVPSPEFVQPSARDIYTVGGRLKSKPGAIGNCDYVVEGAYQFGNFRDTRPGAPTTRLTQDAYMAVVQAGYTFSEIWGRPRLGAEFDYGSGDDNAKDGTHGTFDNLFPTNHRFYGSMDLASLQNIEDVGVNLSLWPHERVNFTLMGNFLWLANTHDSFYAVTGAPRGGITSTPGTGFGINSDYSSYLGSELTLIAAWSVTRFAQLEAGYAHFFHGDYIAQSWSASGFGARDAEFAYLQLNLKF